MPAATPISIYKTVHTGAKSQLGGLKMGLFKFKYQSCTLLCVAIAAIAPTTKQMLTQIAIRVDFLLIIFFVSSTLKINYFFNFAGNQLKCACATRYEDPIFVL